MEAECCFSDGRTRELRTTFPKSTLDARWLRRGALRGVLGGVDKFEPVSGGGDMDHAEEAVGELVVAGGDGAVDFEMTEHALDAVLLLVERAVMFDLHPAI